MFAYLEEGVSELLSDTPVEEIERLFELALKLITGTNIQAEEVYKAAEHFIAKCKKSELFEVYNRD